MQSFADKRLVSRQTETEAELIENIYISGLKSDKVEDYAVYMTMEYEEGDTNKTTPKIHDIYIKDCELSGGSKGTNRYDWI